MSPWTVDTGMEMTADGRRRKAMHQLGSTSWHGHWKRALLLAGIILSILTTGCDATDTDIALDAKATLNHRIQSLDLLVFVFLLALTVLTIWLFKHHRVSWLHETGLAVIYGMIY